MTITEGNDEINRLNDLHKVLYVEFKKTICRFSFLQIPPYDGHPCSWLTLPTTKRVRDLHPIVIAHAGRT